MAKEKGKKKSKKDKDKKRKKDKKKKKKKVDSEVSEPNLRARRYGNINANYPNPKEKYDVDNMEVDWGDFDDYDINFQKELGRGSYGQVLLGKKKSNGQVVAIKCIFPEKEKEIYVQNELKMLLELREGKEIVHLVDAIKNPANDQKMFVLEFIKNPVYKTTYHEFTDIDARIYLYLLLNALDFCHSKGIMHRDVKGGNVLYNPKRRQLRLVDWGFGAFYIPGQEHTKWMGTRRYKSPEMFLHYSFIDYACDVWGFGCIMARVIYRRSLFRPMEDTDVAMMAAIARYLGTADYEHYVKKFEAFLRRREYYTVDRMQRHCDRKLRTKRVKWQKYVNDKNKDLAVPEGIDLLDKLMLWDHEKRISAPDALAHKYFDPVREMVQRKGGCCCPTRCFGLCCCGRAKMHQHIELNSDSESSTANIDTGELFHAVVVEPDPKKPSKDKKLAKAAIGGRAAFTTSSSTTTTTATTATATAGNSSTTSSTTATDADTTNEDTVTTVAVQPVTPTAAKVKTLETDTDASVIPAPSPDQRGASPDTAAGVGESPDGKGPEIVEETTGQTDKKAAKKARKAAAKAAKVAAGGKVKAKGAKKGGKAAKATKQAKAIKKVNANPKGKKAKKKGGKGKKGKKVAVGKAGGSASSFNLGRRPPGTSVMTTSSSSSSSSAQSGAGTSTGAEPPKSYLRSMLLRNDQKAKGATAAGKPAGAGVAAKAKKVKRGGTTTTTTTDSSDSSDTSSSPPVRIVSRAAMAKAATAAGKPGPAAASSQDDTILNALPKELPPPRRPVGTTTSDTAATAPVAVAPTKKVATKKV